eukprot:TRINITY_DN5539_c0_g1_i1.p1 TRINITY_DN5539_c0_g1~~TRINITY_DN5539_c0_g1_i1.p1  ORF type:complete len:226 (-),score=51.90 TRINITY_DN5539_c0_g1_i1:116-793(-)
MDQEQTENIITEGKAFVNGSIDEVFYNPIQVFNRDLSILMIRTFQEVKNEEVQQRCNKSKKRITKEDPLGLDIFEAMSATGLRSIRYAKEIPSIRSILVNDIESHAVEVIKNNIESNGLDTSVIIPNLGDCKMVMMQKSINQNDLFDVVDLDPYGSAAPFLDAAVQSVDNGGLMCVTCTDTTVLCGTNPETCWAKYQAVAIKSRCCHESALRILLGATAGNQVRK